jgi:CubicO group peptidase (beta-lactamase class C family)
VVVRRKGRLDLIWHSGGTWGFRSFAALIPDHDLAVVVLSKTARSVDRLGVKIVDLLLALGCEAPARRRPSASA